MDNDFVVSKYVDDFINCLEAKMGNFDNITDLDKTFCKNIAYNYDEAKKIDSKSDLFSFYLINRLNGFIYTTIRVNNSFFIDENNGSLSIIYYENLKTEFEKIFYKKFSELYSDYNKDGENHFEKIKWIKNILNYIDNQCSILKYTSDLSVDKTTLRIQQIDANTAIVNRRAIDASIKVDSISQNISSATAQAAEASKTAKKAISSATNAQNSAKNAKRSAEKAIKSANEITDKVKSTIKTADNIIPHMLTSLGIFVSIIIAVVAVYLSDLISISGNESSSPITQIDILRYAVSGQAIINIIFVMLYIISRLTDKSILLKCPTFKKDDAISKSANASCNHCKYKDKCKFPNKLWKKSTYMVAINYIFIVGYIIIFDWWYIEKYIWNYFNLWFLNGNKPASYPLIPTIAIVLINLVIGICFVILNAVLRKKIKDK